MERCVRLDAGGVDWVHSESRNFVGAYGRTHPLPRAVLTVSKCDDLAGVVAKVRTTSADSTRRYSLCPRESLGVEAKLTSEVHSRTWTQSVPAVAGGYAVGLIAVTSVSRTWS